MIVTEGRKPEETREAIDSLIVLAHRENLLPHHLHLGFFNLRDLMRLLGPIAAFAPGFDRVPRHYSGIPFLVMSLDDTISLCCKRAGQPRGPSVSLVWQSLS